jgi:hypothetical protein
MEEIRNAYKFWPENLKGRGHSEDLGVDAVIICKHKKEEDSSV